MTNDSLTKTKHSDTYITTACARKMIYNTALPGQIYYVIQVIIYFILI